MTADQPPSTLPISLLLGISLAGRGWGCFCTQLKSISWSPLPTSLKINWLQLFVCLCFPLSLPLPWAICHQTIFQKEGVTKGSRVSVSVKARKCCELKHKEYEGCSSSGGTRTVWSLVPTSSPAPLPEMFMPGRYAMVSHMGSDHCLLGRYLKQLTKD